MAPSGLIRENEMNLFGLFGTARQDTASEMGEIKALTNQFFATLRAYAATLPETQPRSAGQQKVEELLKQDASHQTWSDAYQVEQLLVHHFSVPLVDRELERRVLEARTVLRPEIADYYTKEAEVASTVEDKRALLLRLVNDLQWRYTVNEVKRDYSKEITSTVSRFFIYALVLILAGVILMALLAYWRPASSGDRGWIAPASWIAVVLMAGAAGGWGAMFSVMIGLRNRLHESSLDDLKLARRSSAQATRPLIGVGAALVLFFFLQSQLLGGEAFPEIPDDVAPTGKNLAMLLVWCFVAGFSEKLVPSLLARTEQQGSDAVPVTPGNPRPPVSPPEERRPPNEPPQTGQ